MNLLLSVKEFLFGKKSDASTTIFPDIKTFAPMPNVKIPKGDAVEPEKIRLTEPVELIIKAMKERPETFDINMSFYNIYLFRAITVVDNTTKWKVDYIESFTGDLLCSTQEWIKQQDIEAIHAEVCIQIKAEKEAEKLIQDALVEKHRLEIVALYKENT